MRTEARRNLLLIAARTPRAGTTKTRLGATIGMERAALLYKAFLADLADQLTPRGPTAQHAYTLGWANSPPGGDFRKELQRIVGPLPDHVLTVPQLEDTDWTLRQRALLAWGELHGYGRTVLIASDIPHIQRETIIDAFDRLDEHDVVVGPSRDGGYNLIGQRGSIDPLRGVPMSSDETMDALVAGAARRGFSVSCLPESFDIDQEGDLYALTTYLEGRCGEEAKHTRHAVSALGLRAPVIAVGPRYATPTLRQERSGDAMATMDILNPDVASGIGMEALAASILSRLSPEEQAQFLADLDRWNARYAAVLDELIRTPEWREIEQWRNYILTGTPGQPPPL